MEGDEMDGKLAANIDEEALFEVLASANFAGPVLKATVRTPACVIEPATEADSIFAGYPDRGNRAGLFPRVQVAAG
jgi:hypothetical protein